MLQNVTLTWLLAYWLDA